MIEAARFLVRSEQRERWNAARAGGVTATLVSNAATPAGFRTALAHLGIPDVHVEGNPYFDFGNEQEVEMMQWAHSEHSILANSWLIAGENPLHMATPDGLNLTHDLIAECKTTGTDWVTIPAKYRRQIQWQLHVTGAERCLFVWQLRLPDGDYFRPAWWEPKHLWVDRDEQQIAELVDVAERLIGANSERIR